jgi:hypothetical protein
MSHKEIISECPICNSNRKISFTLLIIMTKGFSNKLYKFIHRKIKSKPLTDHHMIINQL